jgi:tetratricopeptide (TPR) repeat protein
MFDRLFGKRKQKPSPVPQSPERPSTLPPDQDPDMIRAFDGYGREVFIAKKDWKTSVLIPALEKAKDDPGILYSQLLDALNDGFAAEIVAYAEHLHRTDTEPARGAVLLAAVYMDLARLDEAERTLQACIDAYGEEGYVLTNLAKVRSRRGDDAGADALLWHALELDPNQENGLAWFAAMHRERGGETAALEAHRRAAALPNSWRALLWLARDALTHKELASAKTLYSQAISRAGKPVPADLLTQMSGDLGQNGHLREIVDWVGPVYEMAIHGLQAGNNLIKAHVDLGELEKARTLLDGLYALKRPDWQKTLSFWDGEIAKARIESKDPDILEHPAISMVCIEAPLWTRGESPLAGLMESPSGDAPRFVFIGSTALLPQRHERATIQMSDGPGRMSRIIPLLFAERVRVCTNARGFALLPQVESGAFVLFGEPMNDEDMRDLAKRVMPGAEFIVSSLIDARSTSWKLVLRIVRIADGRKMAEEYVEAQPEKPGEAVERLWDSVLHALIPLAGMKSQVPPTWYHAPIRDEFNDFMLRLEQLAAVTCCGEGGDLNGEREILHGMLQLCVRLPDNSLSRILLAQTAREMKKTRPEIVAEFREKIALLQHDHPLEGQAGDLADKVLAEALA